MKRLCLLFILFQLAISGFAQGPDFSTIREVYAFAVGDTFEYQVGSRQSYEPYCHYEGYTLTIITSFNTSHDTILYTSRNFSEAIGACCQPGCGFSQYAFSSGNAIIKNADSSIFYNTLCPNGDECLDTEFSSSSYNFHKQNQFYDNGFNFVNEIYADSLGLVYSDEIAEDNMTEITSQLIYLHKTTGEIWGQPQSIVSGVKTLQLDPLTAQIFPIPIENNFNLTLSQSPFRKLDFLLFDATGKTVFNQPITNIQTEMDRNGLSDGLYLWELISNNEVLQRGKLVLR